MKPTVMLIDDLKELQDAVAYVSVRDVQLGRALDLFALHLARLSDLDYPIKQEEAQASSPAPEAPVETSQP